MLAIIRPLTLPEINGPKYAGVRFYVNHISIIGQVVVTVSANGQWSLQLPFDSFSPPREMCRNKN